MEVDSLLSEFHNAADLIVTAVFALLCLKLMVAVEKRLNMSLNVQTRGQSPSGTTKVTVQNFSTGTETTTCTSDPSAGDVLRIHFGYYNRNTFVAPVGNSAEEMENAALFGIEKLEELTPAIKRALGDNLNSWSVDIFVERLAFFCHIRCRDCQPKDKNTDDATKPVLALTKMQFSSGNGKSPFCRRHIFTTIRETLQDDFIVYDAGDQISRS